MPAIGAAELKKEIHEILKDADLASTSAKKVRLQLEDRLGLELSDRKQEIDKLVMNYVNSQEAESEGEEEEVESEADDSEEETKKKPAKRAAPAKKAPSKKRRKESDEEGSESGDSAASEELKPAKKAAPKKKAAKKKGSGSDSDEDWSKKKKGKKAGGKGKVTGYTKEYKLSPELAKLMGKEAMPRHEVVKQVWAIIKERNLYDPNNKQFAICDSELLKVFGTKRFRTFGMMKYLKTHFHV